MWLRNQGITETPLGQTSKISERYGNEQARTETNGQSLKYGHQAPNEINGNTVTY